MKQLVRLRNSSMSVVLLACLMAVSTPPSAAQEVQYNPMTIPEADHVTSPPLRDLPPDLLWRPSSPPYTTFLGRRPGPPVTEPGGPDPVAQEPSGPLVSTTNLLNIDGQKSSGAGTPDANGAVGATQFVQTVNTSYTVYNKTTGAIEFGPFDLSTIWTSLGGLCSMGTTGATRETDPVVLYDKPAARWVISEIAFTTDRSDNMACWAVSTTSDATGSYHLYSMDFGRNFPDYPKMATWPDAYYTSFNMFTNCSQRSGCTFFQGAKVCALNRSAMLQGLSMSAQCFQRATEDMSFLPSDLDGKTLPPSGSPNYFVEILGTGSTLLVFKFHVDFTNSADTTFSRVGGVSGIAPFSRACGGDFPCIPQPSPGELLDSVGDRLMFRLAYRNFGTHESLVVNHSVNPGIGPASAVRWYEIRSPGSSPFVFQQGTVTTANSLWVGSIAMDKNGDIAVGYSESATILDPSVFYTGRVSSDPKGTMETPKMVVKGTGVQERTTHRWGDYSSMSVDPANDCTFWYTQEYYKTNGSKWDTRIVSFKFNSCT